MYIHGIVDCFPVSKDEIYSTVHVFFAVYWFKEMLPCVLYLIKGFLWYKQGHKKVTEWDLRHFVSIKQDFVCACGYASLFCSLIGSCRSDLPSELGLKWLLCASDVLSLCLLKRSYFYQPLSLFPPTYSLIYRGERPLHSHPRAISCHVGADHFPSE